MRCLAVERLDATLGSLWTLGGTLSSAAVHSFIHSFLRSIHSFIHVAHTLQMLALWPSYCWAPWSAELPKQTREHLPSSCSVEPPDGPGTLLQSSLMKAAPFCHDPGPPPSFRREKCLSSTLSDLPISQKATRALLEAERPQAPSLWPSLSWAAGPCVPRRETPVAACQRSRPASACSPVGLQSSGVFVSPPMQKTSARQLFCASLCVLRRLPPSSPWVNDGEISPEGARDGGWDSRMLRVSGSGRQVAPPGALGKASCPSWP